jgi:hypothetical protein
MPPTPKSNDPVTMTGAQQEMYNATFGNMAFMIQPSQTGEVSNTFGIVPYLSLESVIYAQSMNAQTSPVNLLSGQNSGQQNIQGQYTIQDSNGLTRMVMGYQPGGF